MIFVQIRIRRRYTAFSEPQSDDPIQTARNIAKNFLRSNLNISLYACTISNGDISGYIFLNFLQHSFHRQSRHGNKNYIACS